MSFSFLIVMNYFYYSQDGQKFHNRIEAIRYNIKTGIKVFFYYHDNFYNKLDWTIEPSESLEFHYKQQAQRIRDEYDYVILCYSGGYDSTNILETFHYNNIRLDKIVTTGPFSQDPHSDSDQNHNGEIYRNAFPYLKRLGLDSITQVIDYTTLYGDAKQFSLYELGENWIEEIGSKYSPHNFFWRDLDRYIVPREYEDKKIAIIWGTDKPCVWQENDKKVFYFLDTPITSYGRFKQPRRHNTTNINFYWDPDYPLILLKQLHTLKNYKGNHHSHQKIAELVYPFKQPLIYKSGKSPLTAIGIRDSFLLSKQNSEIFDFYKMGIDKISDVINTPQIKNIQTRRYILE